MSVYVLFDTNSLPSNFEGLIWKFFFYYSRRQGLIPALSEVVVQEAVNRQHQNAVENIDGINKWHKLLSAQFASLEGIYIPTADEVADHYREILNSKFISLLLNGSQAIEALRREALRILPARNGSGSRDAAIWLTVRDLVQDGHEVALITANSKDFGKGGTLHPALLQELSNPELFSYYGSLGNYLTARAPLLDAMKPDASAESMKTVISRIAVSWLLTNQPLPWLAHHLSLEELASSEIEIFNFETKRPYEMDGDYVFPSSGEMRLSIAPEMSLKFEGWISLTSDLVTVTNCEIESVKVVE